MTVSYVLYLLFFLWATRAEDLNEIHGKASTQNVNYTFARIIPVDDHYSLLLQYEQEDDDESQFLITNLDGGEIKEQEFFDPKERWNLDGGLQVRGTSAFHFYYAAKERLYIFYTNRINKLHVTYFKGDKLEIPVMKTKKSERILLADAPQVINGHFFLVLEKRGKKRGIKNKYVKTFLLRSSDFLENPSGATWVILPEKGLRSKRGETNDELKKTKNPPKSMFSNTKWDPATTCTYYPSLLQLNESRIVVTWITEYGLMGRAYGDNLGESFTDSDWVRFSGMPTPEQYGPVEFNGRMITPPRHFPRLESHQIRHRNSRTGLTKLRDGTIVMLVRNSFREEEQMRFYWLLVGEVSVNENVGHVLRFFQPELLFKMELSGDRENLNPVFDFVEVGEKIFLLEADKQIAIHEVDRSLIELIKTQETITEISEEKLVHMIDNPRIRGLHKNDGLPSANEFTIAMWLRASNYGGKHREYCGNPWDEKLARKNRCLSNPSKYKKELFLTIAGSGATVKIEFEAYMYGVLINIFLPNSDVVYRLSTMCGSSVSIWNQKDHMVAFVYDGETLRSSVDEVLCDGDSEKKQGWRYIGEGVRIGSSMRREDVYCGGFSKVVMYHRALRHTEVIGLWRQGLPSEEEDGKKKSTKKKEDGGKKETSKKEDGEKPSSDSTSENNVERTVKVESSSEPREKTEL